MSFNYFKKRNVILKHNDIIKVIERLSKEINRDYKDKELIIVALMNSCLVFLVELLMRLTINVEVSPVKVSTYTEIGEGHKTGNHYVSPDFKWEKIKNRDVLILDDLIDTGDTLSYMTQTAKQYSPKSIKTIVLFDKKDVPSKQNIKPDYLGVQVPNVWITGFGLDYNHKYRNIRDLVELDEEDKH